MLVPAGILVLLILGAIAVDSAVVVLASRQLTNRTAAVANDIAAAGVSEASFYLASGEVAIDPSIADGYVGLSFAENTRPATFLAWSAAAATSGRTVEVTATAEVRLVFAPALPGRGRSTTVSARSVATARGG